MEAPKPLTQVDLDQSVCENPDCDHSQHDTDDMVLKQACHDSGMLVQYSKSRGVISIECIECGTLVCEIMVAAR